MLSGTSTEEIVVKATAAEFWDVYGTPKLTLLLLEKLPHFFQKIELLEGDGGAGTVVKVTFVPGVAVTTTAAVSSAGERVNCTIVGNDSAHGSSGPTAGFPASFPPQITMSPTLAAQIGLTAGSFMPISYMQTHPMSSGNAVMPGLTYQIEKYTVLDHEKRVKVVELTEGEIMALGFTQLRVRTDVLEKDENNCIVKISVEYEIAEDAADKLAVLKANPFGAILNVVADTITKAKEDA